MGGKRHEPEEDRAKLRRLEALTTQGQTVAEASRAAPHREPTPSHEAHIWK